MTTAGGIRPFAVCAFIAGALLFISPCAASTVDVAIFAINDLHGNLMPPEGGISLPAAGDPGKDVAVAAGGVEYMATMIRALRAKHHNAIFVAAGDLIGASPLLSGLFHDEPTIESLSRMGLEVSAVGNHEFDKGPEELLRLQKGGCHPVELCQGGHPFRGAGFRYLAANVVAKATGKTFLPPVYVKRFQGIAVAFIGVTLQGTADIVTPSGTVGLAFQDEAETVNALVPGLQARGIKAIILLIHEGGVTTGGIDDCPGLSGRIVDIVSQLDKGVRVVVSGHTHRAYNCVLDGRILTSARSFGTLVTEIDLKLDARTHDLVSAQAHNLVVRDDLLKPDKAQSSLIAHYQSLAAPLANRVVGKITQTLLRAQNGAGESAAGDVVADGELAAGGDAQIAFVNNGGIRADFAGADGVVTHADAFSVQPFGNSLVTLTLTGAQIRTLLEEQWTGRPASVMLQVSKGFSYDWDAARPTGDKVVVGSVTLNGKPVDPAAGYRVSVPDLLADGGAGFTVLREGKDRQIGIDDLAATEAYLQAHSPVPPPPLDRIHRLN